MADTLKFTIPIRPRGQMRARAGVMTVSGRAVSRTYKHKDQRLEEEKLTALLLEHRPPEPLKGPIILDIKLFLPIPRSKSKKWQAAALRGQVLPEVKPDWDNAGKNLCDVMKRVFWRDDAQVVDGRVRKYYGDPPRYEVEITQFEAGMLQIIQPAFNPGIVSDRRLFRPLDQKGPSSYDPLDETIQDWPEAP